MWCTFFTYNLLETFFLARTYSSTSSFLTTTKCSFLWLFPNLSHQSHVDGYLDHWQIFAGTSSVSRWPFFVVVVSLMRCARCWVLASLDFLLFSGFVYVLNAQRLLLLNEELRREGVTNSLLIIVWVWKSIYILSLGMELKLFELLGALGEPRHPKIKPWVTHRLDSKLSLWLAQVKWLGSRRGRRTALLLSHYSLSCILNSTKWGNSLGSE